MLAIHKCQQFKVNKSEKREPRVSEYQCINMYNNEKRYDLDEYKGKGNRYVSFSFNAPCFSLYKESNCLTDLNKEINSLNHLICILKIGSSNNC